MLYSELQDGRGEELTWLLSLRDRGRNIECSPVSRLGERGNTATRSNSRYCAKKDQSNRALSHDMSSLGLKTHRRRSSSRPESELPASL